MRSVFIPPNRSFEHFSAGLQHYCPRRQIWSDHSQVNDTLDLFRRNTSASMADFDGLDDFCDDDPFFMSMTQENLDEAKPGKFYRDSLKSVKDKYPERYESQTGPNLLGQFGWHDPNFHCSMHFPGCVLVPSCQDIVRGIRKARILGHENVGDHMRDVVRQEFFAVRKIDEMARFVNQVEVNSNKLPSLYHN
jgi:hypothetical protein